MAPPAAPKAEQIPNAPPPLTRLPFNNFDNAPFRSRSGALYEDRYVWTILVRNELEAEFARERRDAYKHRSDRSKNSRPSADEEDRHQEPKIVHGQRRKREDDDDDEETAAERFTKRRNVNVDAEKRPSQPSSTSDQTHAHPQANAHAAAAAPQATSQPVYPYKFSFPDDGPWHQAMYNEVDQKVYSEIYDEAYFKAYNLAYNDSFKVGYGDGCAHGIHDGNNRGFDDVFASDSDDDEEYKLGEWGVSTKEIISEDSRVDGCHDGDNRGYEDGYRYGYKELYPIWYAEGQEFARDILSREDKLRESTVSNEENTSERPEDEE